MSWTLICAAVTIIVLWLAIVMHAYWAWQLRQESRRAAALNQLLMQIAVESFARHHAPMWHAWAQTMGSISVEVHGLSFDGEPPHTTPAPSGERTEVPPGGRRR